MEHHTPKTNLSVNETATWLRDTNRYTHDYKPTYKVVTNFPTADASSQLTEFTPSNTGQVDIDRSDCQISGQSRQGIYLEFSSQSEDEDLFF